LGPTVGDLAAFAAALARRYDGTNAGLPRVRHWQIWNEPNLAVYLTRRRAAERYRAMVNAAYREIHAAAGDNVVVAGGLAPFGVPPESAISPLRFMRRMLCMSGRARPRPSCGRTASFDIWATHPYTSGGPNHEAFAADDVSLGDLPEMRRLLAAARRARHVDSDGRVRFWVTEFSWDTKPPDDFGVPVRRHGRWVAEAMYRMWRSGVSAVVWFQLRDNPPGGRPFGQFGQAGLFFHTADRYVDERPKPAARAFRFPFVALPAGGGVVIWGRTPDSDAGRVRVERRIGGHWARVATARANRHGIFRLRRSGLRGETLRARAVGDTSLPFEAVATRDVPVNAFGHRPPPG
jgi:hypothetical protein